jgi:uncharacterized membrane protein
MAKIPVRRPQIVGAFATRPRLVVAIAIGLAVGLGAAACPGIRPSAAAALGWDALCLAFIVLMTLYMKGRDAAAMRSHAAQADEGRLVILALILIASAASFGAIGLELAAAKGERGPEAALFVGLAFFTVAMSWCFVQLNFTLHYAHAYYTRAKRGQGDAGGLAFPGDEPPDYWDFLHFSIVIGVASQTADVAFTSKMLRRLGTTHSLFAFVFNTIVVALTINMLASLF